MMKERQRIYMFLVVVILGTMACWSSLFNHSSTFRNLWVLQLANTYSPFTKWESQSASYFRSKTLFQITDTLGRVVTLNRTEFMANFHGPHQVKIPFSSSTFILSGNGDLRAQAEDLLKYTGCDNPDKYFGYASINGSHIRKMNILYVSKQGLSRSEEILCGTK